MIHIKNALKIVESDPKDNMIIETAYEGRADLIVTGDGHLLEIEKFRGIKIVTIEEAFRILHAKT